MQRDRQSQVLHDNLSSGLFRIDELYKKFETQWINCFLMLAYVKPKDKWQSVWCWSPLKSVCAQMCLACSYLQKCAGRPSKIPWLAASSWLSQSVAWRREMGKGWWWIVGLTCRSLLLWPAAHPPGDVVQVSLVIWWPCVQARNGSRSAFSSGRVKGAGCLRCPMSGNAPISSFCHLNGMSSSGGEEVTNVFVICRRRGERKAQAVVFVSARACCTHLDMQTG